MLISVTLKSPVAFSCGCPGELVIKVKDSAFLTPAGKYFRAKLTDPQDAPVAIGTSITIQFDDTVLAVPSGKIASCDIDTICCMTACDLYLEGLINA